MSELANLLSNVKNLEIKTKQIVEGMNSGDFRSLFRGGGIEFSQVRAYVLGDDPRRIDWNVSARMDEIFVKEFQEEKELNIYVLVDISASTEIGIHQTKKEISFQLAASLLFSAAKNNDRVGLALLSNKLERFIPSGKGRNHIFKSLSELVSHKPQNTTTDLKNAINQIQRLIKKRSVLFVISDFLSPEFTNSIKMLSLRHHVILLNIFDEIEMQIPNVGYTYLEDIESGKQILVNTSDPLFQKEYSQIISYNQKKFHDEMKKMGVDVINLSNTESFDITFNRYFRSRGKR